MQAGVTDGSSAVLVSEDGRRPVHDALLSSGRRGERACVHAAAAGVCTQALVAPNSPTSRGRSGEGQSASCCQVLAGFAVFSWGVAEWAGGRVKETNMDVSQARLFRPRRARVSHTVTRPQPIWSNMPDYHVTRSMGTVERR
jgi:hypothetical protein